MTSKMTEIFVVKESIDNEENVYTEYSFDEIPEDKVQNFIFLDKTGVSKDNAVVAVSKKHWKVVKPGTDGALSDPDPESKIAILPLTNDARKVVDSHYKELKVGLFGTKLPTGTDEVPLQWHDTNTKRHGATQVVLKPALQKPVKQNLMNSKKR